jgi:hypothetical protein
MNDKKIVRNTVVHVSLLLERSLEVSMSGTIHHNPGKLHEILKEAQLFLSELCRGIAIGGDCSSQVDVADLPVAVNIQSKKCSFLNSRNLLWERKNATVLR